MSDRYLCKAKRTDNGEWVKGYPIIDECGYFIMPEDYISERQLKNKNYGYELILIKAFDVDPETLCQYTGLTDKNGKRWQGDIFEASDGEFIQRYFIQWNEYELQWYAECVTTPDDSIPLCEFRVEEIDVIGNIFDNPELLEGGAE